MAILQLAHAPSTLYLREPGQAAIYPKPITSVLPRLGLDILSYASKSG